MPPKGTVHTHTSGQGSTTSDPFLHGSEGLSPETTSTNEENVWKRQGRLRAQARESPRAPTLTHARATPPSAKHKSTAQHTKQSPAGQREQAKAAQAHQRASDPNTVVSQANQPSSNVAPEPLPEVGRGPSSAAATARAPLLLLLQRTEQHHITIDKPGPNAANRLAASGLPTARASSMASGSAPSAAAHMRAAK